MNNPKSNNKNSQTYPQVFVGAAKNRILIGSLSLIICILITILLVIINSLDCEIVFSNNEDVYIECFESLNVSSPTARVVNNSFFSDKEVKVSHIDGSVKTSVVGEYPLTYQAKFGNVAVTTTKTVHVIDTVLPDIQLKRIDGYYVTNLNDYIEEGFIATDNYDGDITNKVEIINCGDYIVYTVRDSSGNEFSTDRKIPYKDEEAPTITLNGPSNVSVIQGREYVEFGYTAIDNHDGDMTNEVAIASNVNIDIPGYYKVNYLVSDSAGNVSQVDRTVQVVDRNSTKIIYLTFDDGPSIYTKDLLDILDKYNVKATFFVTHTTADDIMQEIVNRGHAIGAHTYTHDYSIYQDEETYFSDLNQILDLIANKTGVNTKLIRFPGGSSNTVSLNYSKNIMTKLSQSVVERGFVYFDWSVDGGDAENATTRQEVAQNIINGIKENPNPIIVLQHDTKVYSIDAVEDVIRWGIENGYTFDYLTCDSPTAQHKIQN